MRGSVLEAEERLFKTSEEGQIGPKKALSVNVSNKSSSSRKQRQGTITRGSIPWILTFYRENCATIPSFSYKIFLEHQEK